MRVRFQEHDTVTTQCADDKHIGSEAADPDWFETCDDDDLAANKIFDSIEIGDLGR
jgi:hypothetical protein